MGYYVNPKGCRKELWLELNGHRVLGKTTDVWENAVKQGRLPVVLMDNGFFTAAGVCFSKEEYQEFTNPKDSRPKLVFVVDTDKLLEASDLPKDMAEKLLALKE